MSSDVFDSTIRFDQLGLKPEVLESIQAAGFEHPTVIQAQLIPAILAGEDVMGQAKTGTGKTAAFGLPLLHLAEPGQGVQALVLAPTRELAQQIVTELDELGAKTGVRSAAVVGGEAYRRQIDAIKREASIIVGTPGRVMDLHQKGLLSYDRLKWVVLDEVDRMLDIGFREDIRRILSGISVPHQTIFVSATISEEIERLARRHMKPEARKISTVAQSLTVSQVTQHYVSVQPWDKNRMCLHVLRKLEPGLTVIFCRTKRKVDKLAAYLTRHKIETEAIHAGFSQSRRNHVMSQLRDGKMEVLVASDLASRGLDVEGITHVINFDLPEDPDLYIHRIGRTARAGRKGEALALVQPDQGQLMTEIEKLAGVFMEKLELPDFEPAPKPEDWKDELPGGRPAPKLPEAPPPKSRYEAVHAEEELADPALFPGGIVPKGPRRKSLGSRFRRGR